MNADVSSAGTLFFYSGSSVEKQRVRIDCSALDMVLAGRPYRVSIWHFARASRHGTHLPISGVKRLAGRTLAHRYMYPSDRTSERMRVNSCAGSGLQIGAGLAMNLRLEHLTVRSSAL